MNQSLRQYWLIEAVKWLFIEPFKWFSAAFFQSTNFTKIYEKEKITGRIIPMVRLAPLLFLISYLFMLIARTIRFALFSSHFALFGHSYTFNPYPIDIFFVPANSVYWSTVLALLFILACNIRFGITYGIGTSIAFTMLSVFIRLFNPAESAPYPSTLMGNALTGFAIGIVFVMAFATTGSTSNNDTKDYGAVKAHIGIIRGIGFGIVLLIILQHLENADFQALWDSIRGYGSPSALAGLIGCVAVGIALGGAGDFIIISSASFNEGADILQIIRTMLIRGIMGGVIFGITFAFVLTLTSLGDIFNTNAADSENLEMAGISLGFVGSFFLGSFLEGKKGTLIRILLIATGLIIVGGIVGSINFHFFRFSLLDRLSSGTSPSSWVYYATFGFALGIIGGGISSHKNWRIFVLLYSIALLIEIIGFLNIGLADTFTMNFEYGIVLGVISSLGAGLIIALGAILFAKIITTTELARGIIFTIATVIAAFSLRLASFDSSSAYTDLQTAITIGFGCLVVYIFTYYGSAAYRRLLTYPLPAPSAMITYFEHKGISKSSLVWISIISVSTLLFIIAIFNLQLAVAIAGILGGSAAIIVIIDRLFPHTDK